MAQKLTINNTDYTSYLAYGSLVVKYNTADFRLINAPDPAGNLMGGPYPVVIKDPNWSGFITATTKGNLVDLTVANVYQDITATNTLAPPPFTIISPFGLSDTPSAAAASHLTLEDGSGVLLLEDGTAFAPGDYQLETGLNVDGYPNDTYGYRELTVHRQKNVSDSTITNLYTATIFQPGLARGMGIEVANTNQAGAIQVLYPTPAQVIVSQVTTFWDAGHPVFLIECTDIWSDINLKPLLQTWRTTG